MPSCIRVTLLFVIVIFIAASGCRDTGRTVWSKEVQSPDGQWLAKADTKQWSGPGNAYVATSVCLQRTSGREPQIEVLSFSNNSAYPSGSGISMEWTTPKHLTVTNEGHATLNFQAIKCADIEISYQELSREKSKTPQ